MMRNLISINFGHKIEWHLKRVTMKESSTVPIRAFILFNTKHVYKCLAELKHTGEEHSEIRQHKSTSHQVVYRQDVPQAKLISRKYML